MVTVWETVNDLKLWGVLQSKCLISCSILEPFLILFDSAALSQDLVVRILFTLGNLTAEVEDSRQRLFECEGCLGTLLQLYRRYQRRAGGRPAPASAACAKEDEDEDVLVKLVRVLANMCTHPAVGPAVGASEACVELLLDTLGKRHPSRLQPAVNTPEVQRFGGGNVECL